MSVKISVIIPCRNSEKHLKECLDSVVLQTLTEIEIICVNNNSCDKTPSVLDDYKRRFSNIKVLSLEQRGAGVSRNLALKNAIGEYVAFIDSDDCYPNATTLEMLYNTAKKQNIQIVGGSFSLIEKDGKLRTTFGETESGYTFSEDKLIEYVDYQFDYGYHRFIYNRKFLVNNNITFPAYLRFQDPPFFVTAMHTAKLFYAVPEVVYCYRLKERKWALEECKDLVRGLTDNFKFSQDYNYPKLHLLTLKRITEYYYTVIAEQIGWCDDELDWLLYELVCAVDLKWLNEKDFEIAEINLVAFLLKEINKLKNSIVSRENAIDEVKNSLSYRVGRILTFPIRRLKRVIRKFTILKTIKCSHKKSTFI